MAVLKQAAAFCFSRWREMGSNKYFTFFPLKKQCPFENKQVSELGNTRTGWGLW